MLNIYTSYICRVCSREFILITSEVQSASNTGNYLACPYCGSRRMRKGLVTDDLREVMKARRYKRNSRGAIEQI
ncbi:hypothetical protein [Clostridium sp. UBA3887]|uniref:hypothetical protein n=1 Tax=Clostridium sp. UBA3887 TaxID=1946356 RepID=UPI003216C09D